MNTSNDSTERITQLFTAQKNNLSVLRKQSISARKKTLKRLQKEIVKQRKTLQEGIFKDFKKPALETDITEIYPTIAEIKHNIKHLAHWAEKEVTDTPISLFGYSSFIQYEPKGNVLIITPWNYPIYLSFSAIVSTVAAGNAVLLKPSEFAPNVNAVLQQILQNVFDENQVAVVQGDYTVSTELLTKKFDHIHFTGSPTVGKIIMQAAAKHLSSCTLELGGKSPVVVDETAHIKQAAERIVWGKFINAGQTCVAPDYVLVHQSKKDELIQEMKKALAKSYGNEIHASADFCRIINAKNHKRLQCLVENAIENNAVIECGGHFREDENYISPTIISNISNDILLMQEEIFGPILPIQTFKNLDDAVEQINNREKPLALYIFSKNKKNTTKILAETNSGGVSINETLLHLINPYLPFGGVNNSGIGKSHGKWGFIDFSNEKSVLKQNLPFGAASLMKPPYTKFTKKLIDFSIKWL